MKTQLAGWSGFCGLGPMVCTAIPWAVVLAASSAAPWAADPVVSNVRASQRAGRSWWTSTMDLADADSNSLNVTVAVSNNGGATYTLPAVSFTARAVRGLFLETTSISCGTRARIGVENSQPTCVFVSPPMMRRPLLRGWP